MLFLSTAGLTIPLVTFWLSGAALAFTFVGYHALISLLSHQRATKVLSSFPLPNVCVVIVARNEEARIVARIHNLLDSDYPSDKLRILLVSDRSTDATVACTQGVGSDRVTIVVQDRGAGKAAGLNTALAHTTDEIIVFADARQHFSTEAISRLVAPFADSGIGAVSGALEIASAASSTGAGVDAYWRYEKTLRANESRIDSCIGCTGAIYAIRRDLFSPIPDDTLLDDVVIPMQIALQGRRVIHESTATAFDPQTLDPATELRRKQRTLAGNFQMLFRYPQWLSPFHNRLWWQLISHKYLRLVAPLFLIACLLSNVALARQPFYAICLIGQLFLYLCAILGIAGWKARLPAASAAFVFLNVATLRGFFQYLARDGRHGWT